MITAALGQGLVLLALASCLAGCVLSSLGGRRGNTALMAAGYRATTVLFAASASAVVLLVAAFVRKDFTLRYVAEHSNIDLPPAYSLTAFWSGQEGSLLLWLAVLAGYAVLMLRARSRVSGPMLAYANAVVLAVAAFFALLVAVPARPFEPAARMAADGSGLSPALQNYWMAIHPPTLYLGYIGVAIPFALVMGALLARRRDDGWVRLTRRWTLVAWLALTAGLVFGSRWAYEEIGWGGYWAWDPVENAALMPWLTTTAFLHSIMVQERRGMMRYWNVVLIVITFGLSIFGTFLTRSGILSSVHSFVQSPIGWYFLVFLATSTALSMLVLFRSRELLQARHDLETVVSREATFLFNNVLLVSLAMAVLWGVLYPILTAGVAESRVALQGPYYDFFLVAFGLPLLALMAVAPLVSWRRASLSAAARGGWLAFVAAAAVTLVLFSAGFGSSATGLAAFGFGSFVVFSAGTELVRGAAARRRHTGVAAPLAFGQLFARNRRRYGGYVAHAGVGLLVIAIAGSSSYNTVGERTLKPGEQTRVGAYTVSYVDVVRRRTANAMQTRGTFALRRGDRSLGRVQAGKNFYPVSGEISNEVGIRSTLRNFEDVMVVVDRVSEDGTANVKVHVNPLVNLLWIACAMMVAGGGIAAWPGRRPRGEPPATLTPEGGPEQAAAAQGQRRAGATRADASATPSTPEPVA